MLIDMHVNPAFIAETGLDEERLQKHRNIYGLYKTDKYSLDSLDVNLEATGIDKLTMLPLVLSPAQGGAVVTNEEMAKLAALRPDFVIGFASVDPHDPHAARDLEYAFAELKLKGLHLHPSLQHFYPSDPMMKPIYDICLKYDKAVMFHSGVAMEPATLIDYSHPLRFEVLAQEYPRLRICLAHFGWPWVKEVCMLMLKYRNVYTDTSMLYFDDPRQFYHQCLEVDIGPRWIDRSFRHQVMFGSAEPRLEQRRMLEALRNMDMRESTKDMIFGENAVEFIGGDI